MRKSKFGNRAIATMGNYVRVGDLWDSAPGTAEPTSSGGNIFDALAQTLSAGGSTAGSVAGATGSAASAATPSGGNSIVKDIAGGLFGAILGGIAGTQKAAVLQQQQQLLLAQQQARAKQMQTMVLLGVLGVGAFMLLRRD